METLDEEEAFLEQQQLVGFGFQDIDEEILCRASHRLSAMLPKKLRFSESWALQRVQLKFGGAAGRNNLTFRADTAAGGTESGPLKVYVRLRPCAVKGVGVAPEKMEEVIKATSDVEVSLEPPANAKRVFKPLPTERFTYTRVFGAPTTQQQYFATTTVPLVKDMLSFKFRNSVVVAYGSSGAGKTFTIEGSQEDPGVLPRAMNLIFQSLELEQQQQQQQPQQKRVLISFYEVYNDLVYDLLSSSTAGSSATGSYGNAAAAQHQQTYQQLHLQHHLQQQPQQQQPQRQMGASKASAQAHAGLARNMLRVREDGAGRVCIPGLSEVHCSLASEALDLHKRAARLRQQACTGVNNTSSRSHCILTVKLEEAGSNSSSGRSSQLSFVDLAGSERLGRTKNTGNRLKESLAINGSLMVLGRCLEALKCNQAAPPGAPQRVIPFRESKITHLFKDVLHGWGHLVLSVCVSPVAGDYEETNHVLRYAALATNISMASGPPVAAPSVQSSMALPASVAPDELTTGTSNGSSDTGVVPLRACVNELEIELARVYEQLQEAEAHLVQAEAGIRDEVVQEIQDVIRELRGSYEERLTDLTVQLEKRDTRIQELEQQLEAAAAAAAVQRQQQAAHVLLGQDQLQGKEVNQQKVPAVQRPLLEMGQEQVGQDAHGRQQQQGVSQKEDEGQVQHQVQYQVQLQAQHQTQHQVQYQAQHQVQAVIGGERGGKKNSKQAGQSRRRVTRGGASRQAGDEGLVLRDATNDGSIAALGNLGSNDKGAGGECIRAAKRSAEEPTRLGQQGKPAEGIKRQRRATNMVTMSLPQLQEVAEEADDVDDVGAQQLKRSRKSRASTAKGGRGGGKGKAGLLESSIAEDVEEQESRKNVEHMEDGQQQEEQEQPRRAPRQRRQTIRL